MTSKANTMTTKVDDRSLTVVQHKETRSDPQSRQKQAPLPSATSAATRQGSTNTTSANRSKIGIILTPARRGTPQDRKSPQSTTTRSFDIIRVEATDTTLAVEGEAHEARSWRCLLADTGRRSEISESGGASRRAARRASSELGVCSARTLSSRWAAHHLIASQLIGPHLIRSRPPGICHLGLPFAIASSSPRQAAVVSPVSPVSPSTTPAARP